MDLRDLGVTLIGRYAVHLDRHSGYHSAASAAAAGIRLGARFLGAFGSAEAGRSDATKASFLGFGRDLPKLPAEILPRRVLLSPFPIMNFCSPSCRPLTPAKYLSILDQAVL